MVNDSKNSDLDNEYKSNVYTSPVMTKKTSVDFKPFNFDEYEEINMKLEKGEIMINISATGVLFTVILRILYIIKKLLEDINN